MHKYWF